MDYSKLTKQDFKDAYKIIKESTKIQLTKFKSELIKDTEDFEDNSLALVQRTLEIELLLKLISDIVKNNDTIRIHREEFSIIDILAKIYTIKKG